MQGSYAVTVSEINGRDKSTTITSHSCSSNLLWSAKQITESKGTKRNQSHGINKSMDTKGERWGGMNWESGIDIYTLLILCIKYKLMRTYCIAQGTLLNALWLPKWEGNPKKGRYMYTYS